MKTVIVYAHPWDKSYNFFILQSLVEGLGQSGHDIDLIDLYKEGFNPVLGKEELSLYSQGKFADPRIGEYQKRLEQAEHLFFVFPVWWYDVPAILKGFLDRVLLKNWAYEYSPAGLPKGKLAFIKNATVITTMKSPGWYYRLMYGNSIKNSFIKGTLKFCGIKKIKWIKIGNIENIGSQKRISQLEKIKGYATAL